MSFDGDAGDVADAADAAEEDRERFARAADAFDAEAITDPSSPAFDEAFNALWGYFGAKNELERRPVLEAWLRRPAAEGPIRVAYHLLAWRERASGTLAAVRDCFVGVDLERLQCVVLLSHGLVLPPFRRSGVAAPVRTAPATLARRELARHGLDRGTPTVLVAEMEPVVPTDDASIVRLLSYGRTGFGVIPPAALPYCQPDFRALASAAEAEPFPMSCVVRVLDRERERAIDTALADALVAHLALIHERACEPTHVRALAQADRISLARYGAASIGLLALPTSAGEIERLEPLLRSRALLHYPERYRRDLPDPEGDLAALRAAGRRLEGR